MRLQRNSWRGAQEAVPPRLPPLRVHRLMVASEPLLLNQVSSWEDKLDTEWRRSITSWEPLDSSASVGRCDHNKLKSNDHRFAPGLPNLVTISFGQF